MSPREGTRKRVEALSVRRPQSESLRQAIRAMYEAEDAEDSRPADEVAAWDAIRDAAAIETLSKRESPSS